MTRFLLALLVATVSACSEDTSRTDVGSLNVPLAATSPSGAEYRLRNATFQVVGPESATVLSEDNLGEPAVVLEIAEGMYTVELEDGWTLEKTVDGGTVPVPAELVSPSTVDTTVTNQLTSNVQFDFMAGQELIQFGNGLLSINITVDDDGGVAVVDAGPPPPICIEQTVSPDVSCVWHTTCDTGYWFCDSLLDWADAEAECVAIGGYLVSINTEEEQTFVYTIIASGDPWIGMQDIVEGTWIWSDETPLAGSYTNWNAGEPNNSGGEDCAQMYGANGFWSDADCTDNHPYICEIPGD